MAGSLSHPVQNRAFANPVGFFFFFGLLVQKHQVLGKGAVGQAIDNLTVHSASNCRNILSFF